LAFLRQAGKSPRPVRQVLRLWKDRRVQGGLALLVLLAAAALAVPTLLRTPVVTHWRSGLALKRAQAHLGAHQYEQARTEFRAALRLEPGNAVALRELADMELGLSNTELAFLDFESLTEMHPEDAGGWVKLAELMVKSGQLEAPEALLDKAIELDPQRADARLLRGNIRFRLGRYYGAEQDARAAVATSPEAVEGWGLLVRSVARSQGTKAGLEVAEKAVAQVGAVSGLVSLEAGLQSGAAPDLGPPPAPPRRLRPDSQTGRGNLGAWTREHWPGRMAESRQSFEEALEKRDWAEAQKAVDAAAGVYPGAPFAPFLAGVLALARGDLDMAERSLSEARALAPRLPATVAALGRVYAMKRGPSFTAEQLLRMGTEDPDFSLARYMAARAYIEARDPQRAEAALRLGLKLQPLSPVPYQQLTDYYFGLDRAPEALDLSRQGLERFPQDIGLRMMVAQIEEGTGQPRAAIASYETLLASKPDLDFAQYKLATLLAAEPGEPARTRFLAVLEKLKGDLPSDPSLLDALGWLSFKAKEMTRARFLLEAAVQGAPEEPSFHYHLAMVYVQDKDMARAREELQAALDSPRPFPERIDAVRLLRQNVGPPFPKGNLGITSAPH
jgi:tetratricopeptide (TPR) repeat protein